MLTKTIATLVVGLMVGTGALAVADSEARSEAKARLEARAEARASAGLPGLGLLAKSSLGAQSGAPDGASGDEEAAEPTGMRGRSAEARATVEARHSLRDLFLEARAEGHHPLVAFRMAMETWLSVWFE